MFLRLEDLGRIGIVGSFVLLACSSNTPSDTGGSGGAGSSSGGMASAGTNPGTSGTATSGAGTSSGGSATAGSSSGGSATAGTTATAGSGGSAAGSGGANAGTGGGGGSGGGGSKSKTTFFVTSDTSKTGKLGGLEGADKRCQDLAMKAGIGDHTFHAYLSTATVNAKDRIGAGPWVNSKGVTLAPDVATLHSGTVKGDHTLFIDENGKEINGQWNSSPSKEPTTPDEKVNEHDILTGSKADGTLQAGATCMDWTSDAANDKGQVGHCDGMGPGMATTGTYTSWNSAHASGSCAATWMAGGAGRLYCFAIN